mmetsp:Transcript_33702/g.38315  ORF Transcript_33702/g.38315 Transcript_33702/m.38315 type:complete len:256 (-) Transcript_33702:228-995(-)
MARILTLRWLFLFALVVFCAASGDKCATGESSETCEDENNNRLWYFDVYGLGDTIRLVLHHAGVEFEDNRFDGEEWRRDLKYSGRFPLLQVPVLEYEGKTRSQSQAIIHYLCHQNNWMPSTAEEFYQDTWFYDTVRDMAKHFSQGVYGNDDQAKGAARAKFLEEILPIYLPQLEEFFVESGGSESGYLVGGKLTPSTFFLVAKFDVFFYHESRKATYLPLLKTYAPKLSQFIEDKTSNEFAGYFQDETKRPKRDN